ncbi:hypothetical protein B0H16DRAFT_1473698 [Mycena metata]|uniref:Uncharacterized protein n=1 Tax=Mycena metata TaxID=1033252 RepID=A0AAD7HJ89_9AGAR|nr:hypothetical protein B0H16DRAFT_1473698 [Mycena metata]
MPDCPGKEFVLFTLTGATIENKGLLEIARDVVIEDEHLGTQLLKLLFKADHQVEYNKGHWAQVEYTHSRNAILLFIHQPFDQKLVIFSALSACEQAHKPARPPDN